jgi:hypothetical protein
MFSICRIVNPLKGTDPWHLSWAKSVRGHLPETIELTFDTKLKAAARAEGIGL